MKFEVLRFANEAKLVAAAARDWAALIRAEIGNRRPLLVAVSGGRTAGPFFEAMVVEVRASNTSMDQVHFFWADERCVPPDDPESNFKSANEHLLAPLKIPPNAVHRILGEINGKTAAFQASVDLARIAPSDRLGRPIFDLVLLGMGEDGHTASLFPGDATGIVNMPGAYRAVVGSKPPPQRVTLSYAAIGAARAAWVLVPEPRKATALKESLKQDGRTPLAQVIQLRAVTVIYTVVEGI